MATISRFGPIRHLRAEPNQYILHYSGGRITRRGAGSSYWFNPLSAAVAQVPVEDIETTFLLKERSADYQEVAVQCVLVYRCADPEHAAARVNFTISLVSGVWTEQPLERLASFWAQRAQKPARAYLIEVPVVEAVRRGAEVIQAAMEEALRTDPEPEAMGLGIVSVQVLRVTPSSELDKALQTPTRESIQQKADEAVFQRRALAVEKERQIKENELATEIELARRQEQLIRQQSANRLVEVEQSAEAERIRLEAELARQELAATAYARDVLTRATGDAEVRRRLAEADAEAESRRVELWRNAPARVILGLAAQQAAGKIEKIQHLNLSPDLLGAALQQFLRDHADGA
ncbi:MAG: band 7 protein [Chloroflexi bacterium]|nr:band 7 protein [Chloroflexota bacterium]